MSTECEYRHQAVRFDKDRHGLQEDLYALCALSGSNNTTNERGVLVRQWQVPAIGTRAEVMSVVIRFAASCEGGSLCVGNFGASGQLTPEAYIGRLRRILDRASDPVGGPVYLDLRVSVFDHQIADFKASERALLAELEASAVSCRSDKVYAYAGDSGDRLRMELRPMRLWSFNSRTEVALFERFRCLSRSQWPDSRASGPGTV